MQLIQELPNVHCVVLASTPPLLQQPRSIPARTVSLAHIPMRQAQIRVTPAYRVILAHIRMKMESVNVLNVTRENMRPIQEARHVRAAWLANTHLQLQPHPSTHVSPVMLVLTQMSPLRNRVLFVNSVMLAHIRPSQVL